MEIKGFVPTSLVDWEGKVVCVIFVAGCNFKCGYCSNKDLVLNPEKLESVEFSSIKKYLVENKDFIDGVVISGGEPTLYQEVINLCNEIKELGFKIKLDTNGSNPERLRELLDKELVDYVAMDVKTSFEKYNELTNSEVDVNKIKESMTVVSKFPGYEFRVTLSPVVKQEDVISIANYLKENKINKSLYLQQFSPESCIDKKFEQMLPYSKAQVIEFHKSVANFLDKSDIRNV